MTTDHALHPRLPRRGTTSAPGDTANELVPAVYFREELMHLRCPHCTKKGDHLRSDFFGDWVVCPKCELPFPWRETKMGETVADLQQNGKRPQNSSIHEEVEK